jgi:predicted DNA binding CopG/RHH family protein
LGWGSSIRWIAKTILLRLPDVMLDQIKVQANKRDVSYQSLIKMWLSEKVG